METILIIDDDIEMRDVLFDLLSLDGYEVLLAADGDTGIETFRNAMPDVVITDLQMPNTDGIEVIIELRREFPDLPIIIMTGTSDDTLTEDENIKYADVMLQKPFGVDELLSSLDGLLGHQSPDKADSLHEQSHVG
jgi:two-component system nitrogen regulation response regulator GlnG